MSPGPFIHHLQKRLLLSNVNALVVIGDQNLPQPPPNSLQDSSLYLRKSVSTHPAISPPAVIFPFSGSKRKKN
jgi:hypothetical protein